MGLGWAGLGWAGAALTLTQRGSMGDEDVHAFGNEVPLLQEGLSSREVKAPAVKPGLPGRRERDSERAVSVGAASGGGAGRARVQRPPGLAGWRQGVRLRWAEWWLGHHWHPPPSSRRVTEPAISLQ